jgi:hypothetical protein|tara:strand:- start:4449 stop:4628 length:180 start_codon:yes stop_codon:yes gene_type:complete
MSIKSFHIIFILFSIGITIWLGFWGLKESIYISAASFLFGAVLIFYGFSVFKKFKTISE